MEKNFHTFWGTFQIYHQIVREGIQIDHFRYLCVPEAQLILFKSLQKHLKKSCLYILTHFVNRISVIIVETFQNFTKMEVDHGQNQNADIT